MKKVQSKLLQIKVDTELTDWESECLSILASEIIRNFTSFDLEDVIRYASLKTSTLTRQKITASALEKFIPQAKAKGYVVEIFGCYSTPVWAVTPSSKAI
jgi:hypothetical protein